MTDTRVFDSLHTLQQRLKAARQSGQRIALVPTMGNLHAGHVALLTAAREQCEFLLATIFVNPLQFGANEDYSSYPKTFDADLAALQSAGCDAVYAPAVDEIYPNGLLNHTRISAGELASLHCGKSRPGHFDGVCTVVNILFNMIQPTLAVFGLKDYQQFSIISKMVKDLQMSIELQGIATVRESSGLALSSRNSYLNAAEKHSAQTIYATLQHTAALIQQEQMDFRKLEQDALTRLQLAGLRPDYFHICNRHTLLEATAADTELVILVAAYAGTTRLIDNILI